MFSGKESKKELEEIVNSSNNIGKGTTIEGNIEAVGNIRVEGVVKGNVSTKAKLSLGELAVIEGNIVALNAEVAGTVKGQVQVSELLLLRSSSVIHGDIITGKLSVESGAAFNGNCKMETYEPAGTKETK
jgi:cytoskeletal protein CcmA (bactofilin family)